jgi:hypothetical protein
MRYVKWTFWLLLIAAVASVLHYTLPRHDVVRIVGTENRRIDLGENRLFWATAPAVTEGQQAVRDIRFILAIRPNGREMVYRNEDTGWGWPPYFKFNSSNVQARATDLVSNLRQPAVGGGDALWLAERVPVELSERDRPAFRRGAGGSAVPVGRPGDPGVLSGISLWLFLRSGGSGSAGGAGAGPGRGAGG